MQVVVLESAHMIGEHAAGILRKGIIQGLTKVIGLATGSSPLPLYKAMAENPVPGLQELHGFALDEYVGLSEDHLESYRSVIDREVTAPLGLDPSRVHVPEGRAADLEQACLDYERKIAEAGGIDFQVLGIGVDGHIGFNEPTSSLASRTRIKTLTKETRHQNARFFGDPDSVPTHCLTQGIGTIMESRQIVLIAQGASKAAAVAAAVEGPISAMCPASILQMHPNATFLLDNAAAADLSLRSYYDFVLENLPTTQR